MIDWPRFLDAQRIEYVESGPSTAKGNIYTHCPWCGDADQSYHLGISIRTPWRGYGCWRNDNHRGRNPARLVSALLGVSIESASHILGQENAPALIGDEALKGQIAALIAPTQDSQEERELVLPKEFKPIKVGRPACQMFVDYLVSRKYREHHIKRLCKIYNLHYCLSGLFKYRVIFPVYTKKGLVTWTGRSIVSAREPRYLSLTVDPEVAGSGDVARANIKDCLFNERELFRGGLALILGEGPLDAMRLDFVGRKLEVRGTGLFGKTVSDAQVQTLERLSSRFKRKVFLLDPDARLDNFAMWSKLNRIGFEAGRIKGKWEDPGATPLRVIEDFITGSVL